MGEGGVEEGGQGDCNPQGYPQVSSASAIFTVILFRYKGEQTALLSLRALENVPFCPISSSDSNFNPRNTKCIPVVKIFVFLDLEQN